MKASFGVKPAWSVPCSMVIILALALPGLGQSSTNQDSTTHPRAVRQKKPARGPGKEMAHGGADIGKGAAKGSADLGKGAVGGAGNLVTGHPLSAGASVGKGVGGFGKNVGVGTGKGVAKIGKGVGGEFKKLGGKHPKHDQNSE